MLTKSPALAKKLLHLGIYSVEDLLYHLPYRYDDFTTITPIAHLGAGDVFAIEGAIESVKSSHAWKRRMELVEASVKDETGLVRVVWFNQLYLLRTLRRGTRIAIAGKVYGHKRGLYFANPAYEILSSATNDQLPVTGNSKEALHTRRLVPVYRETKGLTSRALRTLVARNLSHAEELADALPDFVRERENFLSLAKALQVAHFPATLAQAGEARRRFQFEELFLHQIRFLRARNARAHQMGHAIPFNQALIKSFVDTLPFKLTDDQRKAAWHILQDMAKPYPMQRLVEGDVGSGKTVVAFMAAYAAARDGRQAVLMAPTEVLARQHFEGAKRILVPKDLVVGLASSTAYAVSQWHIGDATEKKVSAKTFEKMLAAGEIHIAIGTHALISKRIICKDLALAIVDEQHRFGLDQRAALLKISGDGVPPHYLSMSATPIPRTLALAVYGDLDISRIVEKPVGRRQIETRVIPPHKRSEAYAFMRSEAKLGRQIFVICPRIETNGAGQVTADPLERRNPWSDVKTVKEEYEKLSHSVFPDLRIAMLHGKMKPKEKEAVMKKFMAHAYDLLISTSVIEVGVDVPNASIMAIEGAERFGLAQLYQFRGRVGRGEHKSYCLLLSDSAGGEAHARLEALERAKDGFALAQMDLELRGPGELMGGEQSGMPDIAMEALRNPALIERAREDAKVLLADDPNLSKHPVLHKRMEVFGNRLHEE